MGNITLIFLIKKMGDGSMNISEREQLKQYDRKISYLGKDVSPMFLLVKMAICLKLSNNQRFRPQLAHYFEFIPMIKFAVAFG